MGLDLLLAVWVVTWMLKTATQDVAYAVTGKPNPRYELKKQRAAASGGRAKSQPRYGTREWAGDLYSDALAAHTERRRKQAAAKAQPVDDMVELVREPQRVPVQRRPARRGLCPSCLRTELPADGGQCPTCVFWKENGEEVDRKLAEQEPEWLTPARDELEDLDEPVSVVHDDQHPYCLEPCGPTCRRFGWMCGTCGVSPAHFASEAEAREAHRRHACTTQREEKPVPRRPESDDDLNADEVLNNLMGPGGLFTGLNAPLCDRCGQVQKLVDGQPTCACRPADTRPDAQIIQFPNVQQIEKEITMANSEVTGLSTATAYASEVAETHQKFNAEGYAGALARLGFGDSILALEAEAREASSTASAKWTALKEAMDQFMAGREFYQSNPDAPEKVALVNE